MLKICAPSVRLTKISFFEFIVQIMTRREGFLPKIRPRTYSMYPGGAGAPSGGGGGGGGGASLLTELDICVPSVDLTKISFF